jgi:hypothetical protein
MTSLDTGGRRYDNGRYFLFVISPVPYLLSTTYYYFVGFYPTK